VRVALDVSFLDLPPSGTATYVRSLAAALEATFPQHELVYLRPGWVHQASPTLPGPLGRLVNDRRLRRFAWEAVGIGRGARWVRPDLLHVPHFSAPAVGGVPVVVTVHDVIPLVLPEYRASRAMRLHLALMRRTVRRARLVLTPSQAAAHDVATVLGIPAERIRVTPEAADPAFRPGGDPTALAAVRARLGIGERYVFNVGGLDIRKNLPDLLNAFALVLPHLAEPAQLVIAGAAHSQNPAVFPPLEPVVDRLGLGEQVRLIGRVSEADKLALFQGAALYVTPSLYEGFGLTPLEAMACGVPTIAANRTSLPEVVGDGGLLVEPTPEALAAAMVAVLNDPEFAREMSARGIGRAAEFSWERTARLTMAAYEEAMGLRSPGSRRWGRSTG
jgi:glycosyltransferase involved in cell wall biosynthesis